MTVEEGDIIVVHRLGHKQDSKPRQMVVRCAHGFRDKVFKYTKNLKGVKNDLDEYYFVDTQLPEPLRSEKIELEQELHKIRKYNDSLTEENKDKRKDVKIKNKTLYINSVAQKTYVYYIAV